MTGGIDNAKSKLRQQAYLARRRQTHKQRLSEMVFRHVRSLDSYRRATFVLWYVDCRSEVRTKSTLTHMLASGSSQDCHTVVIPYCTTDDQNRPSLGLWELKSLDELVVGKWKILEPPPDQWFDPARRVCASQLDLVIVPGVAFDHEGYRLGNGQGYYDRLLATLSPDCCLVGVCFDCQIVPSVPRESHDRPVDFVVTPTQCLGRKA